MAAGKDTFSVGLSYDFARLGLTGVKAFTNYAHGELPAGQHQDEVDVTADYRVTDGPLKNIWLRLRYAHNATSNQPVSNDFQVIINYTFAF